VRVVSFISLLVFGLLAFNCFSQDQAKVDSLKKVIETATQDTTKIKALNILGWTLMYSNPDTAIILGKQALALSEKIAGLPTGQAGLKPKANTLIYLGVYHWIKSDYPKALEYHFKALEIHEKQNNLKDMAISYNNIGLVYQNQSDYPRALDYYFKSLKIEEELGNKQGMAMSYTTIGSLYTAIYWQIEDKRRNPDKVESDTLLNKLGGTVLIGLEGWAARNPARLLDTAMYYQQKALLINKELSDEYTMTFTLSGIASILMKKGEAAHAAQNTAASAAAYSQALEYYQQAALLADSIGALKEESDAHSGLAACYEKLGSYKLALKHYKEYAALKDSVFNEAKSKDIGKLEAKHEFETAEAERKRMEEEQAKLAAAAQSRRDNLQYSGILIFLVLVFAGVFMLGRFSIPIRLAEGMIFFSFLLFFEFMLVMLDPYIEQYSSGAPAIKLGFNAVLAGLIFPLHSIVESKLKQRLFKTTKKLSPPDVRHEEKTD